MKRFMLVLLSTLAVQACDEDTPVVGGRCTFDSIPGTALVQLVTADTLSGRMCDNAVFVYFDFVSADSTAPSRYRIPNWPDTGRRLLVGDGKNPPLTWVEAEGLTVGTSHPCVRLEETRGTCTPVQFRFLDIDYSGWTPYCEPVK